MQRIEEYINTLSEKLPDPVSASTRRKNRFGHDPLVPNLTGNRKERRKAKALARKSSKV